jgi:hypothetical protein
MMEERALVGQHEQTVWCWGWVAEWPGRMWTLERVQKKREK